jgi:hypothetical protein
MTDGPTKPDSGPPPPDAPSACTTDSVAICTLIPMFPGVQTLDGKDDDFCGVPSFVLDVANAAAVNNYNRIPTSEIEVVTARVGYSSAGLHGFFDVKDSSVVAPSQTAAYLGDSIEIYFSSSDVVSGPTSVDTNTYHVIVPANAPAVSVQTSSRGVTTQTALDTGYYVQVSTATGYAIEVQLPWPGGIPNAGDRIRFDLALNSARTNSTRDAQLIYHRENVGTSSCRNPDVFCDDRTWCPTTLQGNGNTGATGGATGGSGGMSGTGGAGSGGTSTGGTSGACNPNVLLLGDTAIDTNTSVQAALQAQGLNVTLIQDGVSSYDGTPAATGFGVVVVAEGISYALRPDMPAAGQSAIVNANAGGVGVVFTDPPGYAAHSGYWAVLKALTLITFGSANGTAVPSYTLTVADHPLWAGLPQTFTSSVTVGIQSGAITNGGTVIATLADTRSGSCAAGTSATPCVAVAVKDGVGRIVHDGTFFNFSAENWYTDPNLFMLFANSIKWAAHCL